MMKVVVYHKGGDLLILCDGSSSDVTMGKEGDFTTCSRVFCMIMSVNQVFHRKILCERERE